MDADYATILDRLEGSFDRVLIYCRLHDEASYRARPGLVTVEARRGPFCACMRCAPEFLEDVELMMVVDCLQHDLRRTLDHLAANPRTIGRPV